MNRKRSQQRTMPAARQPETEERNGFSPDGLPFAHLNLRRNPFGTVPEDEFDQVAVGDVDELVEHLRRDGTAVQITGERGRGKSTHLRMIHDRFPDRPMIYVCEDEEINMPEASFPFVDEFQRVGEEKRQRFYRNANRLVMTTHRSFDRELTDAGFHVRTLHAGVRDTDRLKRIIDRRIEWARRSEGEVPRVPEREVKTLQERFGTDLRSMFEHLYDEFQQLEAPEDVQL